MLHEYMVTLYAMHSAAVRERAMHNSHHDLAPMFGSP